MNFLEIDGNQVMRFIQPDNWHVHLRELVQLPYTVPYSAGQFGRILAMPNTAESLTRVRDVLAYQGVVKEHGKSLNADFHPFAALYLTDETTTQDIRKAHAAGIIAAKLYPMGATTQSHKGVTEITKIYPVLAAMQDVDMVLSVHCEVKDGDIDFFDRERVFIDRHLSDLVSQFPSLRIVVEHVSTSEAVQFVIHASSRVGATVTPQHLMLNRNMLFAQGLMPSFFCYPVINSVADQRAVAHAVVHERFFLGTDSAPHPLHMKYREQGSGGCFTEPWAMVLYAEVFERMNILSLLEDFASVRGARFYGVPSNTKTVQMTRMSSQVPDDFLIGQHMLCKHFLHGQKMQWQFNGMVT
jgi:dihydroorotase